MIVEAAFAITTRGGSLRRSSSGRITGAISASLGARWFPDESWNDFAVVILGWWIDALLTLLDRKSGKVEWLFMDGPYRIDVAMNDADSLSVQLVCTGLRDSVVASGSTSPETVLTQLEAAGRTVLDGCDARGWVSDDVEDLRSALKRLRRLDRN